MTALPLTFLALAFGAEPTALDALKAYDALMAPPHFKAVTKMTAHRDDGSTREYRMAVLKGEGDKSRIWFSEPAAVRGQEMLRNGENLWVYMPNLKRALRLASRESFQGGDFNNADIMRADYAADYDATLEVDPSSPDTWLLKLKAKTKDASYDSIKLWVQKAPLGMPVKGEYFTASGKLLRSAKFSEVKDFGHGATRPSRITMRNELATQRFSELVFDSLDVTAPAPDSKFALADLGR
ncbi:MAG: hypothetical protein AMXMBFR34_14620 [Myxococcaceae bacterium]